MKCDTMHQACLKGGFPVVFFSRTTIKAEPVEETDKKPQTVNEMEDSPHDSQKCPDGHECPSSFTCCKMYRGSYGCCPYSDAKCCMDGFHCCPHGSECDAVTGGCLSEGNWLGKAASMIRGKKPKTTTPKTIGQKDPGGKCPDGHPCLEKYTCCKVQNGGYGCCPYTNGVCCTDLIHCCPQNTMCNNSMGTCDVDKDYSVPMYSMNTLRLSQGPMTPRPATDAPEVMCPDQRSKCASSNTCCSTRDGSFACCPMEEATCCSENDSCCPGGYQCAEGGKCVRVSSVPPHPFLPPLTEQQKPTTRAPPPSVEVESMKVDYVHCPDGSLCPDGNTCCQVSYNGFGCCPMPQATCCGDMKHCCPHGTWCAEGGCERLQGTFTNTSLIAFTSIVNHTSP